MSDLGWDEDTRMRELKKVICNSRFLIVPWLRVKNLASHVLSLGLKRLSRDWEEAYQTRPILVETFVDKDHFEGTCYKASNWTYLGETKGRGRNDRFHKKGRSRKYLFAYELEEGILGEEKPVEREWDWVEEEFQYVKLPNEAKKKRLVMLTRDFFLRPASPLPLFRGES